MADDLPPFVRFRGDNPIVSTVIEHWRKLNAQQIITVPSARLSARGTPLALEVRAVEEIRAAEATALGAATVQARGTVEAPEVAIGFAIYGDTTDEGQVILAVTPAWEAIISELAKNPDALRHLDWRQLEELVASGWRAHGWQVTLTPRSGDRGRDVIAERSDVCAIRTLDQVKLHKPGNLVEADDVRAMWGVLDEDRRASKAYVTTTSGFAPGVYDEFSNRMPTRLELRNGAELGEWLTRALQTRKT
jgi:restriction system protein